MAIEKDMRSTLIAVELDEGEELRLRLGDGTVRTIVLEETRALIYETTLEEPKKPL